MISISWKLFSCNNGLHSNFLQKLMYLHFVADRTAPEYWYQSVISWKIQLASVTGFLFLFDLIIMLKSSAKAVKSISLWNNNIVQSLLYAIKNRITERGIPEEYHYAGEKNSNTVCQSLLQSFNSTNFPWSKLINNGKDTYSIISFFKI